MSKAGLELEDLVQLKSSHPRTSFVFIFHSTKQGQFRGGNALSHEVDVIIEVEPGLVQSSGRFHAGGELRLWFLRSSRVRGLTDWVGVFYAIVGYF